MTPAAQVGTQTPWSWPPQLIFTPWAALITVPVSVTCYNDSCSQFWLYSQWRRRGAAPGRSGAACSRGIRPGPGASPSPAQVTPSHYPRLVINSMSRLRACRHLHLPRPGRGDLLLGGRYLILNRWIFNPMHCFFVHIWWKIRRKTWETHDHKNDIQSWGIWG